MIVIEKGIPLPSIDLRRSTWGFLSEMEIGDSVMLKPPSLSSVDGFDFENKIRVAASRMKRKGRSFTVRSENDGFRIWRVS